MTKREWIAHINMVNHTLLFKQDTVTIRMILAFASLLWGAAMLAWPQSFALPAYRVMAAFCANPKIWAFLFILHYFGVLWRIYDPTRRPTAALVVNSYGLAIWLFVTVCINLSIGFVSAGTATEWAMCAFAAWSLYRTGYSEETVSA